jgi:PTEN induced putative kinase 1
MAPEIVTALSSSESYLDYRKADVWTAGTLAYEIFGQPNPFYYRSSLGSRISSSSYSEEDLPLLNNGEFIQCRV